MSSFFREENANKSMSNLVKLQLVDLVRRNGKINATDLAETLKIHKSTVSQNLQALTSLSLIREAGTVDSGSRGGKPRQNLELNPECCHVIGIDASPTHLKGGVFDFQGRQLFSHEVKYTDLLEGEIFLQDFYVFTEQMLDLARTVRGRRLGIGIGFSGIIDSSRGHIFYSQSIGLRNHPLAEDLQQKFGTPVRVMNDANAALLGEKWFVLDHQEKSEDNVLYFFIDGNFTSVGFGLLIEGKIYEGARFQAGEASKYMHDLKLVSEVIDSIRPLGIETLQLEELFAPHSIALGVDKIVSKKLFEVYSNLLTYVYELFNPGLVVLGGNISVDRKLFLDPLLETIEEKLRQSFPLQDQVPIRTSGMVYPPVCTGATVPLLRDFVTSRLA